ncbi:MAG: NAD-dependent epimerase/dehydratase family protein [Candidatus Magasanikbacteria bacterium]|nr:NAD-dependent epimerase/dehydratase family protein [Candidatus Magasanikbacteria bacterium]
MNSSTKNERILITGASGFTARALISALRVMGATDLCLIDRIANQDVNIFACDVADAGQIAEQISFFQPTKIYHLIGSFTNDYEIDYRANVLSTKNIFDALIERKISARVLLIGSSAEYGDINSSDNPISENQPLHPFSVYGLTKVFQTALMNFYYQRYNLDIVMARTFNLYGEGISPRLFAGKVNEQIKKYQAGQLEKITIDDLSARRDYISIAEAVQYYQLIMDCGKSGELYNVGSGHSISGKELIEQIAQDMNVKLSEGALQETGDKINVRDFYADIKKLLALESNS